MDRKMNRNSQTNISVWRRVSAFCGGIRKFVHEVFSGKGRKGVSRGEVVAKVVVVVCALLFIYHIYDQYVFFHGLKQQREKREMGYTLSSSDTPD